MSRKIQAPRGTYDVPLSASRLNISFWTTSVASPTPRANNSVNSNVGVSMRP